MVKRHSASLRALFSRHAVLVVMALSVVGRASAQTSSPFQPPAEKLGTYVINSQPGSLDTGCTFRSGSPLRIRYTIPATMNPAELNADGSLKRPDVLVRNGVIGSSAVIRFPVFDIDSGAITSGFAPEVDYVNFNGTYKKTLQGLNNTWTDDSFVVDTRELRFTSTNSPSAINELRVDIDQANIGNGEFWCMAVDWVATQFDAAAPYTLLHGINADSTSWTSNAGAIQALNSMGVLYRAFSTDRRGSVVDNGRDLLSQITGFLAPLKAEKINILAHSKGGLDAQFMQTLLTGSSPPFKILSLVTFSTPHLGSSVADATLVGLTTADDRVENGTDPGGLVRQYIDSVNGILFGIGNTFNLIPQRPGLDDLTTAAATEALRLGLRGNIPRTFSFGASADLNGNGALEDSEIDPYNSLARSNLRMSWQILRDVVSVARLGTRTIGAGPLGIPRTVLDYQTTPGGPFPNDIVVTVRSANPSYATPISSQVPANHSTLINFTTVLQAVQQTVNLR